MENVTFCNVSRARIQRSRNSKRETERRCQSPPLDFGSPSIGAVSCSIGARSARRFARAVSRPRPGEMHNDLTSSPRRRVTVIYAHECIAGMDTPVHSRRPAPNARKRKSRSPTAAFVSRFSTVKYRDDTTIRVIINSSLLPFPVCNTNTNKAITYSRRSDRMREFNLIARHAFKHFSFKTRECILE